MHLSPRRRPAVLLMTLVALVALACPAAPAQAASVRPLPTGTDVDYQLGGPAPTPDHVGIVVRDRTARPVPGRYNVCYVNGFQSQGDEGAFWRRHPDLLLHDHGRPVVDESWGEFVLDIRTRAKRAALARIMGRWVAGCAAKGYDAVEFDNLDSYTRSHHLMTRRQAVAYATLLVRAAHRDGLAAGQKNLASFDGTSVGYDFAIAEECAHYDECGLYVRHYGARVLMIEYTDRDFAAGCRAYGATHAIVRRDRDLRPGFTPRFC